MKIAIDGPVTKIVLLIQGSQVVISHSYTRIWLLFLLCLVSTVFSEAGDLTGRNACKPLPSALTIDRVWGGTRVGFGTQETKDFYYAGYYDTDRWLTVSQINKCTGEIKKIRLPSQFAGWDAHNKVMLAQDSAGRLHVAGNMHTSPLVYARMDEANNLGSLTVLKPMVGVEENRMTYPNFFHFPDGALGFSYRSGGSGNGKEYVNRFDGARWTRWIDQPLFAPASSKEHVNAYHTGFIFGPDGFFHIAWVWRENHNVETNFHVNYAKSRDLKNWQNSSGKSIALPITPQNAEVVDPVNKGSGLLNNIRLGFDAEGRVVISYLKFDTHGFSQLFHARREAEGWKTVQSTDWKYQEDPRGGGTIPSEIAFSGMEAREGQLLEHVRQPEIGSVTIKYVSETLRVDSILKHFVWKQAPEIKRKNVPGAVLNIRAMLQADGNTSKNHAISWFSHPADNRDKPRECKSIGLACDFTSEMQLHTSDL